MHMAVMVQALREVPLDAIECYPLVAVVMPTAIHVQNIQKQYFAPSVFSGASIRHK